MHHKTELSTCAWQGQTVLQCILLHSPHRMCLWLLLIEFVIIKATRLYCAAWWKIFFWQLYRPHTHKFKRVIAHTRTERDIPPKARWAKIISHCSFSQRLQTKRLKMMKIKRTQWKMSGMTLASRQVISHPTLFSSYWLKGQSPQVKVTLRLCLFLLDLSILSPFFKPYSQVLLLLLLLFLSTAVYV